MAWATFSNTVLRVSAEIIRQTPPVLLLLVGFAFACGIAVVWKDNRADQVRVFGMVLQVGGIALVAYGLSDLRREFKRPGVFARMWAGVVAIGKSVRPQHQVISVGAATITFGAPSPTLTHGRVRGTIEQRLDGLEREIDDIRNQAGERERKMLDRIAEVTVVVSKESQERKDAHAEISKRLDSVAVGGLNLEVIGLSWLLIATLATSIPEEIARWF